MKNRLFKTMVACLVALAVIISFAACSKDEAGSVQNGETSEKADNGENQSLSPKSVGFDMDGDIVTVDGKTIYKDYTDYPETIDIVMLDEKTGEKEKLDFDVPLSCLMFFTGEKLYLTISHRFEYLATEGFLEYDIATKSSRTIDIIEADSDMAKPVYVDNNYIYYYIAHGPEGPYEWIKQKLENGEATRFLPDTAALLETPEGADYSYSCTDNFLIYSVEEKRQDSLYTYDFEKSESYKICENGEYLYSFSGRVYYINNASQKLEIRSCDLQGQNDELVKKFDLEIDPYYIIGSGHIVYLNSSEGVYEFDLQSGEYKKLDNSDEIDGFIAGDEKVFGLYGSNYEDVYEHGGLTVYDLNNGFDNKKVIADKLYDPFNTLRVQDNKLYCIDFDYNTRESELKIIPIQ